MATGNITTTTAAVMIPAVWTKEVELPFYKALVFGNLVQQRGELVQGGGNLIHVPFLSLLNARSKSSGTSVTYDNNTEAEVQISINKNYYSAVLIEDIAKVQASYDLQNLYRTAQAEAVARQIDSDLAGLYGSAGNTVSAGATVADSNIISIVQYFDANNVPRDQRYGVIGAYTHSDLLNVNKYVTYENTGKAGVAVAGVNAGAGGPPDTLVASVYGMDLHMSNNVTLAAGSPNLGENMFFHKKGLSLALQLKPTYKMEDSVDYIGMKAVLHSVYGVAVERTTALQALTRNTNA